MKNVLLQLILSLAVTSAVAQADQVSVIKNDEGMKLVVNGADFMINGMNWDYFPIGTNFSYSLWNQSDDIIKAALDTEMSMLKHMGVNVIRQYTGVQPRWIQYIYEKYGIYTMLNHSFGRYGLTLNGEWVPNTEYADPRTRQLLLSETQAMVEAYKNTPGLLLYLLGNENNYGLFWEGAETEDIPVEDRKSTARARAMYKLFNEATVAMKGIDKAHPVAICNGDLLFAEIIAEECADVDIFGVNMYRGVSFGDAFQRVKDELDMPIMFTEFGADAFNAVENEEDQRSQAYYMVGNWQEIYQNAAGMGKVGNSLGGFTFQFSDGWWKFGQTTNLDVHDNNASWSNGGYQSDFVAGENNMNEEWFGICAKGPTNARGLYDLYPRAAYYALKEVHLLDPFASGVSLSTIDEHFGQISLTEAVLQARGDQAALDGEQLKKVRIAGLRAELTTFTTGGKNISTPKEADPDVLRYPDELGFDHMQSFFVDVEANPTNSVRFNVSFNALGRVAENPINEIFYENRGRTRSVNTNQGNLPITSLNRVSIYRADFAWNDKWYNINGFYRTGHYHWGYEGDFFGLYPEANYGPNIDIYNGNAPFGFEAEGKKSLRGLKVAFGPELWWGANPAVLVKYSRQLGKINLTGIFHEDIDEPAPSVSSFAVPMPQTRRATLHAKTKVGPIGVELGGIWGGQPLVGRRFQIVADADDSRGQEAVYQDEIQAKDTWGGKVKFTYSSGPVNWYAQGAAMGLVANGGADYTRTFTGWRLKDSGSGNQFNFLTGFTYLIGDFQIAPNFLWQKPVVGPIPFDVAAPGRPRNILDDPFSVRQNRETVAGEILFTYDPTPGTWMYDWDNDLMEDAPLALSAGFVYRHLPTTQDAGIGIFADGRTLFAFPGAPPAQDLWEVHARAVSKLSPEFGFIVNAYGGNAQANGSDPRLIQRFGTDLRLIYHRMKLTSMVKVNDWGPFDYHRDFNLTFPLQLTLDLSTTVGKPKWFDLPNTRAGVRWTWRSLNQYSPRYCPTTTFDAAGDLVCDPLAPGFDNGREWEIRTYVHFNIGR
ncbi:glycoside hydrolase family 2 TIM barrel-domain containing protein [Flavilitoribacter nigricans]|uniref:Glycosidase n=1 Tax=Flavilitoribacter nigricans (strain ATCC 23147 / DSM 23189 / NBRC 102662 / NCIMB 1420 / SS-2) TaxID=1122177 RepID=A0A2D0N3F1_FLAN2|nr:glycoside hydrolase family 2 TIM barrel-domain containing protein [Flavilitoribacter nigricans]PHN02918.1 glycosidase [Flavilitoribacter nigricans DSM 23189 = NBRC 102662]